MNIQEFIKTVGEMRAAQKAYFKNRLSKDLIRSKDLERRVDSAVAKGIEFEISVDLALAKAVPTAEETNEGEQ